MLTGQSATFGADVYAMGIVLWGARTFFLHPLLRLLSPAEWPAALGGSWSSIPLLATLWARLSRHAAAMHVQGPLRVQGP